MVLLQDRTPAGVVNDDVQEDASAAKMDGIGELAELVDAGCAPVKDHQGWIDGREVQRGIGTAEPAKAGGGGGGRIDRQQVQDAAAQRPHNVRQACDEIAQLARGRDDRETALIQDGKAALELGAGGAEGGAGAAEHPREGAVDRIAGAIPVRVYRNAHIRPRRPVLPATGIDQVALGLETARLRQRHLKEPAPILFSHRNVAPGSLGQRQAPRVGLDDFTAQHLRAPQVGPQQRAPAPLHSPAVACLEDEPDTVADEPLQPVAGRGRHDWNQRLRFPKSKGHLNALAAPSIGNSRPECNPQCKNETGVSQRLKAKG